jgi:hypothetical protein
VNVSVLKRQAYSHLGCGAGDNGSRDKDAEEIGRLRLPKDRPRNATEGRRTTRTDAERGQTNNAASRQQRTDGQGDQTNNTTDDDGG